MPPGLALAFRLFRTRATKAVALATAGRLFIVTSTAAQGLLVLRTITSAYSVHLINDDAMRATLASTVTTSFAAPTTTPELPTATAAATAAMPATAIVAAGGEHLAPASGTSKRVHHVGRPKRESSSPTR